MRRAISLAAFLAVGAWVVFVTHQVWAVPRFARETKAACAACHTNPAGGADLTGAGKAYKGDAAKATVPTDVKGAEYVGSNKCKMCHLREYKSWQATRHAGAFAALEKADTSVVAQMAAKLKVEVTGPASQEDACVQCHVTGFQLAGGFPRRRQHPERRAHERDVRGVPRPRRQACVRQGRGSQEDDQPRGHGQALHSVPHARNEPQVQIRRVQEAGSARGAEGRLSRHTRARERPAGWAR